MDLSALRKLLVGSYPQDTRLKVTNQKATGLESENALNPQGLGMGQYGRWDQRNAVVPMDLDAIPGQGYYQDRGFTRGAGRLQGGPSSLLNLLGATFKQKPALDLNNSLDGLQYDFGPRPQIAPQPYQPRQPLPPMR